MLRCAWICCTCTRTCTLLLQINEVRVAKHAHSLCLVLESTLCLPRHIVADDMAVKGELDIQTLLHKRELATSLMNQLGNQPTHHKLELVIQEATLVWTCSRSCLMFLCMSVSAFQLRMREAPPFLHTPLPPSLLRTCRSLRP